MILTQLSDSIPMTATVNDISLKCDRKEKSHKRQTQPQKAKSRQAKRVEHS